MTGTAAILGCLLAGIEITVSPDQPLAYSYVDDPLIVEVRGDTAMVADVQVSLTPAAGGDTIQRVFPEASLGPAVNRWCAVKDLPPIRGRWDLTVRAGAGDDAPVREATVYRIDRRAGAYEHPLYAWGDNLDRDTLLALRSVAVDRVRIPADHPDIRGLLDALEDLEMRAIVVLESVADAPATAARLTAPSCGAIARWEMPATPETAGALPEAIETIRSLSCSLPVSLRVADPAVLADVLGGLDADALDHLVIAGGEAGAAGLDAVRTAMTALGVESPVLEYIHTGGDPEAFPPAFFEARTRGALRVGFPAGLVMQDGVLRPGLAYVNGLARAIAPVDFAGRLPQDGPVQARLFAEGADWTLASWSDGSGELSLPWSADHPLRLLDGWSNARDAAAPEGDTWASPATREIQFVQGEGGPVLMAALVAEVERDARRLLARVDLEEAWPESTRETLEEVGASPLSDQSRVHFFTLLRAFPEIEERWHAGRIARPGAVAALAGLSDLARTLCRLEAARGATFLEPLQDTLARCEEYQSRYLTGSTTTPQARARGDWLVEEVRRLMDEVESLRAAGAKIEADAVAALAEWRARGLEHAAKAGPLSDQMAVPERGTDNEAPDAEEETEDP